eukprot:4027373-Pleurochrysis_carterae.AAC.1
MPTSPANGSTAGTINRNNDSMNRCTYKPAFTLTPRRISACVAGECDMVRLGPPAFAEPRTRLVGTRAPRASSCIY